MKLAVLCSSHSWGGLEMNILRLCVWMQERGHEILLFCPQSSRIWKEAQTHTISVEDFPEHSKHFAFSKARSLAKRLSVLDYPFLLIGNYKQMYIGVWTKYFSKKGLKIVFLQQMELGLAKKDFYHRFFYRNIDAWISPLQILKEQALKNGHLPENKIHIIPLCMDTAPYKEVGSLRAEARTFFEIPKEVFLVGTVGRLDVQKGQLYLIKALKLLHMKNIPIHALFVGEETMGEEGYLQTLKTEVAHAGLESYVHFRPFLKQVSLVYAALDIFIMSSYAETFGMVTIEAMCTGLPVIGTNSGGTIEILEQGNLGRLVQPKNEQALADAIEDFYKNETERTSLGQRAQERALDKYHYSVECEQLEKLLDELKIRN